MTDNKQENDLKIISDTEGTDSSKNAEYSQKLQKIIDTLQPGMRIITKLGSIITIKKILRNPLKEVEKIEILISRPGEEKEKRSISSATLIRSWHTIDHIETSPAKKSILPSFITNFGHKCASLIFEEETQEDREIPAEIAEAEDNELLSPKVALEKAKQLIKEIKELQQKIKKNSTREQIIQIYQQEYKSGEINPHYELTFDPRLNQYVITPKSIETGKVENNTTQHRYDVEDFSTIKLQLELQIKTLEVELSLLEQTPEYLEGLIAVQKTLKKSLDDNNSRLSNLKDFQDSFTSTLEEIAQQLKQLDRNEISQLEEINRIMEQKNAPVVTQEIQKLEEAIHKQELTIGVYQTKIDQLTKDKQVPTSPKKTEFAQSVQ